LHRQVAIVDLGLDGFRPGIRAKRPASVEVAIKRDLTHTAILTRRPFDVDLEHSRGYQ
jgi:hypothetical protein